MFKKALATLVILLFLGLALAPSINADVEKDDLVELDVEFCGLGGKHTVKLTQEEYNEVELIFEDIQEKVSCVESDDEAVEIFNEAIVKLDKYGLLGGLSVKHVQRIFSNLQRLMDNKFLQRIASFITLNDDENSLCFISGRLSHIDFFRYIAVIFDSYNFVLNFLPIFNLCSSISVSCETWEHEGNGELYKSNGIITTRGLNGLIKLNGEIKGCLKEIQCGLGMGGWFYYIGVQGFFGIQLTNPVNDVSNFFGFARRVNVNYW